MHEAWRGKREVDRLLFKMGEDVKDAGRLQERQATQEKIVNQAKDCGIQPDPKGQGDQSEGGKARGSK
jgi:hypothetical protein